MALRECPSCALESQDSEEICPFCGYEFPEMPKTMPWFAWLFALLLLWPVFEVLKRIL